VRAYNYKLNVNNRELSEMQSLLFLQPDYGTTSQCQWNTPLFVTIKKLQMSRVLTHC